jgi:sulfate adenylyltransferase
MPIDRRQYLELENLAAGVFQPLDGFMTEKEFVGVVEHMRLPNGALFPLPVVLDVAAERAGTMAAGTTLELVFDGAVVGEVSVTSVYRCDKADVVRKVFGTADPGHPGAAHFLGMGDVLVGGPVRLIRRAPSELSAYEFTPEATRRLFAERGWRTVVGFQTRNVPHRAHEYLLRLALEQADGLFIQPLVGMKKPGDFVGRAIIKAYEALIAGFLPKERIVLGVLSTAMRYAGPKEALFHALIRRNHGCSHFIVGRDHAGVGNFYGRYDAHALTRRHDHELGIGILRFAGPFYCARCGGIATERTCGHVGMVPAVTREISGTDVRRLLSAGGECAPELIRPEIVDSVRGEPLFVEENE